MPVSRQISLLPGQSYGVQLRRGAVLRVSAGAVLVRSRVWLEHSALVTSTPVSRGGVYDVRCSGWYEITARQEALIELPAAPSQGLLAQLRQYSFLSVHRLASKRTSRLRPGPWMPHAFATPYCQKQHISDKRIL